MKLPLIAVFALALSCKPAGGPVTDADSGPVIEAGVKIANDVCSLIEGVDTSGVVRTICATVEEVASIVAFILTLRTATDAGARASLVCQTLPGSTLCATSDERAKAVLFVVHARERRLQLDGGAK